MGTVYRARQISLNRIVGVKTVNSGQFASPSEVARFYQEAKAAASLNHPILFPYMKWENVKGSTFSPCLHGRSEPRRALIEGPVDPRLRGG